MEKNKLNNKFKLNNNNNYKKKITKFRKLVNKCKIVFNN